MRPQPLPCLVPGVIGGPFGAAVRTGAAIWLSALAATPGQAQTFDFGFEEFRQSYDKRLAADGRDAIGTCKPRGTSQRCFFNEAGLPASAEPSDAADVPARPVRETLQVDLEDGKVKAVHIAGSRADPGKRAHFLGQFGSLVRVFDPAVTDGELTRLYGELGLLRGDDDPSIGQDRQVVRGRAVITCNQYPSRISVKLECIFEPRD